MFRVTATNFVGKRKSYCYQGIESLKFAAGAKFETRIQQQQFENTSSTLYTFLMSPPPPLLELISVSGIGILK